MIVVDTSVITYLYPATDRSTEVEQAFTQDPDLAVPTLWRSAFRNVLPNYIQKERLKVVLAQVLGIPLVTVDRLTLSNCPGVSMSLDASAQRKGD